MTVLRRPRVLSYPRLRRAVLHPSLVLKDAEDAAKLTADASFIEVKDLVDSYVKMNEATPSASGTNTPKTSDESNVKAEKNTTYAEDILTNLGQQEAEECPICMDVMQSPVLVPGCMHQRYVDHMMRLKPCC